MRQDEQELWHSKLKYGNKKCFWVRLIECLLVSLNPDLSPWISAKRARKSPCHHHFSREWSRISPLYSQQMKESCALSKELRESANKWAEKKCPKSAWPNRRRHVDKGIFRPKSASSSTKTASTSTSTSRVDAVCRRGPAIPVCVSHQMKKIELLIIEAPVS